MSAAQSNHNGTHAAKPAAGKKSAGSHGFARASQQLPKTVQLALKERPATVLAAVAAGSFTLGALAGSRLGRIAVMAALPVLVKRLVEGDVGRDLAAFAVRAWNEVQSGSAADA
jgi:hypothetical protein